MLVMSDAAAERCPPALSPVFYVLDGDEIVVSMTADRHKYRAISNDPEVSLCIIHEQMPLPYVTVYGTGRIEEEVTTRG